MSTQSESRNGRSPRAIKTTRRLSLSPWCTATFARSRMGTGPDTLMIDRGHRATVVPCKFLTKRFKVGGPEGVLNCILNGYDVVCLFDRFDSL